MYPFNMPQSWVHSLVQAQYTWRKNLALTKGDCDLDDQINIGPITPISLIWYKN